MVARRVVARRVVARRAPERRQGLESASPHAPASEPASSAPSPGPPGALLPESPTYQERNLPASCRKECAIGNDASILMTRGFNALFAQSDAICVPHARVLDDPADPAAGAQESAGGST